MQNLIRFFLQYGNILLFILIEIFCFSLIVNQNQNQKNIYLYSKQLFFGHFYKQAQDFKNYLNLSEVADSLAQENALLRSTIRNAKFKTGTIESSVSDTIYLQQFTYIASRIISNSIHLQNNTMILDKGADNDVAPGMGVVGEKGVVGIVHKTSAKFSLVLPLLHSQSRISAAIKRNQYFGSLIWSGKGSQEFKLTNVPKHADVVIGDTIITSGYSTIFPKGIEIGKVDNIQEIKGSNEYNIDTKIYLDFSTLKNVYIVKNLFREEFNNLLNPAEIE